MPDVRLFEVTHAFDPARTHILIKRVGPRKFVIEGLIQHPDIIEQTRLPVVIKWTQQKAEEAARAWARRFGLTAVYYQDSFDALPDRS